MLNDVPKGRPAASLWKSGKGITLHGSVYGGCIHGQVLALQGVEVDAPPPYMQKLFDAGHESEDRTKAWLRSIGVKVKDKSDEPPPPGASTKFSDQIELKKFYDAPSGHSVLLSLHLDGVIKGGAFPSSTTWLNGLPWDGELSLWENKALSPEKFEKFKLEGIAPVSRRYAWQVAAQMVLGREHLAKKGTPCPSLPLVFSVERRDYDAATKTYVLSGERAFQLLTEPPFSAADVEARCLSIVDHWVRGEVPECDSELPCDYARKAPKEVVEPTEDDAEKMAALAARWHSHAADAAYHGSQCDALKLELATLALPYNAPVRTDNGFIVSASLDKRGRNYFKVTKEF